MKEHRLVFTLLFLLSAAVFQLPAQQNEADRKLVAEIRARAEMGDAKAQERLGAAFFLGKGGLTKDEVEAYKWWLLAAGQGNDDAKHNMTIVENKMAREQIAEGQRLARDFKPRKVPSERER
jgi:TPR repeat protein